MAMLALWGPDPFKVAVRHAVETLGLDPDAVTIYYHNENVTATTTALGLDDNPLTKQLWVNGIGMTNLCLDTKLMAHLPLLLHRCPKNVLVICFGMGSTVPHSVGPQDRRGRRSGTCARGVRVFSILSPRWPGDSGRSADSLLRRRWAKFPPSKAEEIRCDHH